MKKLRFFFFIFSIISVAQRAAPAVSANNLSFSPDSGVRATLTLNDHEVHIILRNGQSLTTETIQVDTEKTLSLEIKDYNFDGRKDFSVSHVDDGMGTYTIYQIYVFSPQERKFVPLQPKCGDEFINVVVLDKKRTLTNSYFSNNQIKTCIMKF